MSRRWFLFGPVVSKRWWVFRWRVLRMVIGLPWWFGLAIREGAFGFRREFSREWADRPRYTQAEAAYEEVVEGRYP